MINHTDALLGYLKEAVPTHVIGADPFAFEALARRMIRDDRGASLTRDFAFQWLNVAKVDAIVPARGQFGCGAKPQHASADNDHIR